MRPKAPAKPQVKAQAPVAPKAPVKPGKPGVPQAAPAVPKGLAKAPPAQSGPSVAELQATIAQLKGEVQNLSETVAKAKEKAKAKFRTQEEIVDGFEGPKDDWRTQYHGAEISVFRFAVDAKTDALTIEEPRTVLPALLAFPRDSDLGGQGARARNMGMLAVHWAKTEDGVAFARPPAYVSYEELGTIWAE